MPITGRREEVIATRSERMEALGHFVIQVFLGTHQLTYRDISLNDLVDQLVD